MQQRSGVAQFAKKSIKGIKTLKKEIDVIRQRLKMVQEREHERRAI
jgi:phage-related protein